MKKKKLISKPKRSIIKSLTWRTFCTITTITLIYLFTGKIGLSLKIGIIEYLTKLIIYYLHERIWTNISWGKKWK